MPTLRKYQTDVLLKEDSLPIRTILETEAQCRERNVKHIPGTILVELEETLFYPEGGGQPCDLGTMEGMPVIDVFEDKKSGIVYHRLASAPEACALSEKKLAFCKLDWDRRLTHMQLHSGEHLLSGLIWSRYRGVNKGFHMGKDYATIDILLPAEGSETEFTPEMIDGLELAANRAVWEDLPILTHFCTTREEAAAHPLRKPLALDEDITVVQIGGQTELYDSCACCGTHVPRTGGIGLIKVLKTENYKGMTRITLTAGLAAYKDAALRHRITTALCGRNSTEIDRLMDRLDAQESKNGAARKELYDLKKELLREEKEILTRDASAAHGAGQKTPPPSIRIYVYDRYSTDDLQTLGRSLEEQLSGPLALVSRRDNTAVLLSSGKPDCGGLVRDYAGMYGGKGGGNPSLARAMFNKQEDLDLFLDLIEKHLR